MFIPRILASIILVLTVSACGGGGGDTDGGSTKPPAQQPPVTQREQTPLRFEQANVSLSGSYEPFVNPLSGGSGSGEVSFSSSNPNIVTVDATGAVTTVSGGTAAITAIKAASGSYLSSSASYSVSVTRRTQGALHIKSLSAMSLDEPPFYLHAPGGSGTGSLTFTSDNPNVAEVDLATGLVTLTGAGVATFTVRKAGDGVYDPIVATETVTITKAVQRPLTFGVGSVAKVSTDEPFTMAASGGSGTGALTYAVNNEVVATVDRNTGKVAINSSGAVIVSARKSGDERYAGAEASYHLLVEAAAQSPFTFSQAEVDKLTVEAPFSHTASGGSGTGTTSYASSNSSVATVAEDGTVTIAGVGTAVITATKSADAIYLPITASYRLNIHHAPQAPLFFEPDIEPKVSTDAPFLLGVSGGSGAGATSFSSDNPGVATINAQTGLVTIHSAGQATIRAEKAADNTFLSNTVEYLLIVERDDQEPLHFAQAMVTKLATDADFINPISGGSGLGPVTYQSSDTTVAWVDTDGTISIHKAGTATIIATKYDDAKYLSTTASFDLVVDRVEQSPLSFEADTITLTLSYSDEASSYHFSELSGGSGSGEVTYQISDSQIALVSQTGFVRASEEGNATITAVKAGDGIYLPTTATLEVIVNKAEQNPMWFEQNPVFINANEGPFYNNRFGGSGAGTLRYSTSDSTVAVVDDHGTVTLTGSGSANITATREGDRVYRSVSADYSITVAKVAQEKLVFEPTTRVRLKEDGPFTIAVSGGSGTGNLSFMSSDTAVASVDDQGQVTPLGSGAAMITAVKAEDPMYFSASVSTEITIKIPDGVPPTASILFPGTQSIYDNNVITARGTATDASGIESVVVNGVVASFTALEAGSKKVEWQADVPLDQNDVAIVVEVRDQTWEVNSAADTVGVSSGIVVPYRFTFDTVQQKIVGLDASSLVEFDWFHNTLHTSPVTPSTRINCFQPTTNKLYFVSMGTDYWQFSRYSLGGDLTPEAVHTTGRHIGSVATLRCDQEALYIGASFVGGDASSYAIYRLDLEANSWTTIYSAEEFAARFRDFQLADNSLIALMENGSLHSLPKDGGDLTPLGHTDMWATEVVAGSTSEVAYLVTDQGISQVDIATSIAYPISYEYADGDLPLSQSISAALDTEYSRVVVADFILQALISIDLESGERSMVLGEQVGHGPRFSPRGLAVNKSETKAYLLTSTANVIKALEVDLHTGNRRTIAVVGAREYAVGVVLDETAGLLYAATGSAIYSIDLRAETSTAIAGNGVGFGTDFDTISALELDLVHNQLLFADAVSEALYAVDLKTHERKLVSSDERGNGISFGNINAVSLDSARNKAFVANQLHGTLQEVDLATGDRTELTLSCSHDFGQNETLSALKYDASQNALLVASSDFSYITTIDLSRGECDVRNDLHSYPRDFQLLDNGLVLIASRGELILVDSRSRQRVTISK